MRVLVLALMTDQGSIVTLTKLNDTINGTRLHVAYFRQNTLSISDVRSEKTGVNQQGDTYDDENTRHIEAANDEAGVRIQTGTTLSFLARTVSSSVGNQPQHGDSDESSEEPI